MGSEEQNQESSLDELSQLALGGDPRAERMLFESLRVRFEVLAKRRVTEDDVDDIVQEALAVVHSRHDDKRGGVLPWAFAILRNVIGNYYRKRSRRGRREQLTGDLGELPQAAIDAGGAGFDGDDSAETLTRVRDALGRLAETDPRCALLFRCVLASHAEGGGQREVSGRAWHRVQEELPHMTRNGFYVGLHRCRGRLRALLRQLEGSDT